MNKVEKTLYINSITTGHIFLKCRNCANNIVNCCVMPAINEDVVYATSEQNAIYTYCVENDTINDESMLQHMVDVNLWNIELQEKFDTLPKRIEELKIELYNSYFKSNRKDLIRKQLDKLKDEYNDISLLRYSYYENTMEGIIESTYKQALLKCRLRNYKFKKYKKVSAKFLDSVYHNYLLNLLSDDTLRALSRTDTWRTLWSLFKTENKLFSTEPHLLDENRKGIILWSKLYDSISESPNCPPENIIEDNDVLDGWLLNENRKNKIEKDKQYGENLLGKQNMTGEIFVPVNNSNDARMIDGLNDTTAKVIKQQRFNVLAQKGKIKEQDMPDSKLQIRTKAQQEFSQRIKNGR